jgi:hypothetical protein
MAANNDNQVEVLIVVKVFSLMRNCLLGLSDCGSPAGNFPSRKAVPAWQSAKSVTMDYEPEPRERAGQNQGKGADQGAKGSLKTEKDCLT